MPIEVIVFPDIEDLLQEYLEDNLSSYGFSVPVHVQVPNPRPASFVTVLRVGGVKNDLVVDAATVSVDSWAATPQGSLLLAQTVRGVLHSLVGVVLGDDFPIYRVDEFAGPANSPDPVSGQARYVQTFSIWVRGRPV